MAAIGRRAEVVAHRDSDLCPLAAKQLPAADLARVLAPVLSGALEPRALRLPPADGARVEAGDPVAVGVEYPVELSALEHAGQPHTWQERRLVGRSLALAERQAPRGRQRVARAVRELNALDERTPGQPGWPDDTTATPAAAARLAQQRVEGLVTVTVRAEMYEHVNCRYGTRPATTGRSARVRVQAAREAGRRADAGRRLGGRV